LIIYLLKASYYIPSIIPMAGIVGAISAYIGLNGHRYQKQLRSQRDTIAQNPLDTKTLHNSPEKKLAVYQHTVTTDAKIIVINELLCDMSPTGVTVLPSLKAMTRTALIHTADKTYGNAQLKAYKNPRFDLIDFSNLNKTHSQVMTYDEVAEYLPNAETYLTSVHSYCEVSEYSLNGTTLFFGGFRFGNEFLYTSVTNKDAYIAANENLLTNATIANCGKYIGLAGVLVCSGYIVAKLLPPKN
jgi:hypothetical protein